MAISVDGYGPIHKGNAKEIYLAYNRGEVELNKAQETKCKSFLSPEDMDEITYDAEVKAKNGESKINTEGAEDNGNGTEGGATAGAAVGAAGTIAAVIVGILGGAKASKINGFVALVGAIAALAGSAAALVMSYLFDNQLNDRMTRQQNAGNDNQTLDGYTNGLAGSMEMMNEDAELYKEQSAELTTVKNEQTSRGAELQMEYDTAMAMGDKAGAEKAKAEMQKLEETDNSKLEEDLAETGGALDEYRAMNVESAGVAKSGQTVSDFLKAGHGKAALAYTNAGLCMGAALLAGITVAIAAIPKIWAAFVPVDGPAGLSASITWGAVAAMMGLSGNNYLQKGNQESQCGDSGDEMQTHVNDLNDMMEQQTQYTDDTEATYAETDDASAESQAEAGKQAAGATAQNKENLGNKPKSEKEEKEKVGAPVIV